MRQIAPAWITFFALISPLMCFAAMAFLVLAEVAK